MRLFAAVSVPEEIAGKIYEYSKSVAEYFYAKPVIPENMHITLKFFGDKNTDNCLKIIENSVRNIKRFDVQVYGMDFFSYGKYAGVLWAGIKDESGSLKRIVLNIDDSKKDFIPHVTLARFKNDSVENKVLSNHLADIFVKEKEFGGFTVEKAVLVESVLESGGSRYKIIKEFSLG